MSDLLEKVIGELGARNPEAAFFVPGRIEVLGKHTDYAGGRSLLVALERGFCIAAAARSDRLIRIRDAARGLEDSFELSQELEKRPREWADYPRTVARRLARDFPGSLRGADLALASDLPDEAGLSSSSALVVAVFLALASVLGLEEHPLYLQHLESREKLAEYLACVENGYAFGPWPGDRGVGTQGGSQDHTAILCCRAGKLSQYSFRPVRLEREIPLPPGHLLAVAVSGVRAPKTGSALENYNRLSELAQQLAKIWRESGAGNQPHLGAVLESSSQAANQLRRAVEASALPPPRIRSLLDRLQQFESEACQIIPAVPDGWRQDELDKLASLVDRSWKLGAELLGNQTPETLHLTQQARRLGALAASPFGAGFGGSVWALVEGDRSESFLESWSADYAQAFTEPFCHSTFFLSKAASAAFQIPLESQ